MRKEQGDPSRGVKLPPPIPENLLLEKYALAYARYCSLPPRISHPPSSQVQFVVSLGPLESQWNLFSKKETEVKANFERDWEKGVELKP